MSTSDAATELVERNTEMQTRHTHTLTHTHVHTHTHTHTHRKNALGNTPSVRRANGGGGEVAGIVVLARCFRFGFVSFGKKTVRNGVVGRVATRASRRPEGLSVVVFFFFVVVVVC